MEKSGNTKKLRGKLKKARFLTDSDSEVLLRLLENKHKNNLRQAIIKSLGELDGDYSFAAMDSHNTFLVRDPVGIKPLYYVSNDREIAFCSEKKALNKFDKEIKRVLPGEIVEIKKGGIERKVVNRIRLPKEMEWNKEKSLKEYISTLSEAVEKRVEGHDRIGVIFSGGVDSTLAAVLAKRAGKRVLCYNTGLKKSYDYKNACLAAKKCGLRLKSVQLTRKKIMEKIPDIIKTIEVQDLLQVEVAVPVFLAVEEAKKDGIRVMLTGQGPDELFAGYSWYPGYLEKHGKTALRRAMWKDTNLLFKESLEREDKITMRHSIELRVPFLDPEVIKTAFRIPLKWKTFKGDVVGKHLHRAAAELLGVPKEIAWRRKDAAQHGSGVSSLIEKIASENNLAIKESGYSDKELLGSFYRYRGGEYGSEKARSFIVQVAKEEGIFLSA